MVTLVRRATVLFAALTTGLIPQAIPHAHAAEEAASVRADQWQLSALHAEKAWQYSRGEGVTVAVLDSGVAADHPDLAGQVLPGIDLVDEGGNGQTDPVGHGTTVAGLIAGRDDDDKGVLGLAPRAKILPVRVLDAKNQYDDAVNVAEGVRWAVDHGARVINMSLGGATHSEALAEAIDYAFDRDVVVIACVGNRSGDEKPEVWYPAREPGVLAVTALAQGNNKQTWDGAISGPSTVLTAPGTNIYGARPGGRYWRMQGTSFASPLVAATAALIRARWPQMSAANVVQRLITTAQDLGPKGRDDTSGFGLLDPVRALTAEVPEVAKNPLDNLRPPGRSGFGTAPRPSDGRRSSVDCPPVPGNLPPTILHSLCTKTIH